MGVAARKETAQEAHARPIAAIVAIAAPLDREGRSSAYPPHPAFLLDPARTAETCPRARRVGVYPKLLNFV
ncbi:hypothetical protein ACFSTI_03080 [Rhizorhabdus histidinilytica]